MLIQIRYACIYIQSMQINRSLIKLITKEEKMKNFDFGLGLVRNVGLG